MNIKSISIKNFRVFKEKTTFQLRPFTILTGPNNSGKSSFIKFLLLIKEGVEKLDFSRGRHSLGSLKKVIPWGSTSNEIQFSIHLNNSELEAHYNTEAELWKLNIIKNNNQLASLEVVKKEDYYSPEWQVELEGFYPKSYQLIKINLELLMQLLRENILREIKKEYKDNFFSNYFVNPILYNVHIDNVDVTEKHFNDIIIFQKKYIENYKCHIAPNWDSSTNDFSNNIDRVLKDMKEKNRTMLKNFLNEKYGIDKRLNVEVSYSDYGEFMFTNSSTFYPSFNDFSSSFNFLEKSLKNFSTWTKKYIGSIDFNYLSGDRGSQDRIFYNSSSKEMAKELKKFTSRKNIHISFLEHCFAKLGINGKLEIKKFENSVSSIYLLKDNKRLALSDLGFGYSQVIPIILKLHNLFDDSKLDFNKFKGVKGVKSFRLTMSGYQLNKTLIIEEPEANLHPNLQSKLADLLVYIAIEHKVNFIIETHSEYFIRKLQYLTAKKELKQEDSVIYYFNDDKYVSNKEPKVKEIFIDDFGGLSDSFGPGFFDEATRLQFDLMKLNKEQMN